MCFLMTTTVYGFYMTFLYSTINSQCFTRDSLDAQDRVKLAVCWCAFMPSVSCRITITYSFRLWLKMAFLYS